MGLGDHLQRVVIDRLKGKWGGGGGRGDLNLSQENSHSHPQRGEGRGGGGVLLSCQGCHPMEYEPVLGGRKDSHLLNSLPVIFICTHARHQRGVPPISKQ